MSGLELLRRYEPPECGSDDYPFAWRRGVDGIRIPDLVRQLAGHRCVRCGHRFRTGLSDPEWSPCDSRCHHGGEIRFREPGQEEWTWVDAQPGPAVGLRELGHEVQARRRVLTVHHLTGEKADCRWWNLASLCQRCHLQIQGRVKMGQVYPFEHSAWFKPYAAGYYAATYLGEELTRAETMERLDELLELERVA